MRMEGEKMTEVIVRRNKVFCVVGEESETCEEEGTRWEDRK